MQKMYRVNENEIKHAIVDWIAKQHNVITSAEFINFNIDVDNSGEISAIVTPFKSKVEEEEPF